MILVDTSIWIDHFRQSDATLITLLEAGTVASHPWIIGELAMGNLGDRAATLQALNDLPQVHPVSHEVVMRMVEEHELYGIGIGYVDAHVIASVTAGSGVTLWCRDRRMDRAAAMTGVRYSPDPASQIPPRHNIDGTSP